MRLVTGRHMLVICSISCSSVICFFVLFDVPPPRVDGEQDGAPDPAPRVLAEAPVARRNRGASVALTVGRQVGFTHWEITKARMRLGHAKCRMNVITSRVRPTVLYVLVKEKVW